MLRLCLRCTLENQADCRYMRSALRGDNAAQGVGYLNNMNEIVRLAHERKAGLIVIAAPSRDRVTNPPEADLMIRYRSALRAEMHQKRIPFLEKRLGLDVDRIAAVHGPTTTLDDLRKAIEKSRSQR